VSTVDISYYEGEKNIENLKVMAPMTVSEGEIKLTAQDGSVKTYILHEDFTIFSLNREELIAADDNDFFYKGIASDGGDLSEVPGDLEVFPVTERYIREFLSYTGSPFSENNMRGKNVFGEKESAREYRLQFMLLDDYESRSNAYLHKTHTILPFKELREELLKGSSEIEVSFSYPKLPEHDGRIIEAFLPGDDYTREKPGETIVIGASYDGIYAYGGSSSVVTATPAATSLEVAREVSGLKSLKKSVSFVFWDNQIEIKKNTPEEGSSYYHHEEMKTIDMVVNGGYYYYEIDFAGLGKGKDLSLVTFPAQGGRKPSYLIGTQMEKILKDMKVPYRRFQSIYSNTTSSSSLGVFDMVTRSALNLRLNAFFTVGIGQSHVHEMGTDKDSLENLNRNNMSNIGQVVLDSLTMNPYLMGETP